MVVACWRGVESTSRARPWMYRPVCRACLCDEPGQCSAACSCHGRLRAPVVECEWCAHPLAYTEPVPEGRGTWRSWLAVCSIGCLNAAKAGREPPPPDPRRCAWCGHEFQPRRRSDARFCGNRCRQAHRRAKPVAGYKAEDARRLLEELGVQPDGKIAPRLGDVMAAALDAWGTGDPGDR